MFVQVADTLYVFFSAALSAHTDVVNDVSGRWVAAKVSNTVTSHSRHLPRAYGIIVTPSGLFPSSRSSPNGSFIDGTPA